MNTMKAALLKAAEVDEKPKKKEKKEKIKIVTVELGKEAAVTETSSYRKIASFSDVFFKVPNEGLFMKFVVGHSFESSDGNVKVASHWKFGQMVEGKVIVNRHYYVSDSWLGKSTVGDVTIMLKKKGEREFLFLDYNPRVDATAKYELKFTDKGEIEIPGSKTKISVVERKVKKA